MIFVDERAGSNRLMSYEPMRSVGQLTRLDSADMAFVGNGPAGEILVGVEVKSVMDLISSMNTGRLQATQLPAMLEAYPVRWLLVYGQWRPAPDGSGRLQLLRGRAWKSHSIGSRPVPYGYVEAFLLDCTMLGVNVKCVYDEAEAAARLGVLYRWFQKDWTKHHGMRSFDTSHDRSLMPEMAADVRFRAEVASKLPSIGFERALAAAQHFGSVKDMINASCEEWATIPGIGKVVARAVTEAIK